MRRSNGRSPKVERLLDYGEYPVLFVDDEPENLRVFELTFRREFQIETASSGEEALDKLAMMPYAIVLSDHRMEGMTGVELLGRARELDPRAIRVLVTAYGDHATLTEAINNGRIHRYVPKPWRPDDMRLALRNSIEIYAVERERETLLHELEILNQTSRLLSQELDLVPLLDLLLETITAELGYDGATVLLFEATGERLEPVRSAPLDSEVAQRLVQLEIPVAGAQGFVERLRSGQVQSLKLDQMLELEPPLRALVGEISADEIVLFPLVGHGGVIGALALDNRSGGTAFDASDHTLLDGIASQAAIAIENARLVADLRRERAQTRRAERLGTLGTLAAGLAHEINNPLVSIRTFLSLAPEKRIHDDDDFWGEFYVLACKEVERIRLLVQTMGRLGRESDEQAPRSACSLRELIEEAATLLGPTAQEAQVSVQTEVADDLPKIVAIRDQIHQVVLNLLLNALHASRRGERVRIAARREPLGKRDGVCLEVADQGCGIRSDDLERIFDPFFTTKGPDQGSGLGLMISHRIVSDHGGVIEVESLEGRGSTFRVRLPVAAPGA
ncbi:MAG: ATP-binding protein [Myxococcota bacterium]|nr:ATP-binding protein [Myxococcota bacterium]